MSSYSSQLTDLWFPVKDSNNNIIAKRRITKVYDVENHAGIFITLKKDASSGLMIGYGAAADIIKNQHDYNKYTEL
jgi:hypothetical protein